MANEKQPGKGHNATGGVAADQLKALVDRIERLEGEKAELANDIREIYTEAKIHGFDTKTLRQVVRRRKMERADREEQDAILALYERVFE